MDWECKERLRMEGHQRRPSLHGRTCGHSKRWSQAIPNAPVLSEQSRRDRTDLVVWNDHIYSTKHLYCMLPDQSRLKKVASLDEYIAPSTFPLRTDWHRWKSTVKHQGHVQVIEVSKPALLGGLGFRSPFPPTWSVHVPYVYGKAWGSLKLVQKESARHIHCMRVWIFTAAKQWVDVGRFTATSGSWNFVNLELPKAFESCLVSKIKIVALKQAQHFSLEVVPYGYVRSTPPISVPRPLSIKVRPHKLSSHKKRRTFDMAQELFEHWREPSLIQQRTLNRRGQKRDRQQQYMKTQFPTL